MGSNTREDHDNMDLLVQLNKLTDDSIDMMDAEEAKALLKRLRTPALFHLVEAILSDRQRTVERART